MAGTSQSALRRKTYLLAKEIGLSRADRMDLAEAVLVHDVNSWSDLDEQEIGRIADALNGYAAISHLVFTARAKR